MLFVLNRRKNVMSESKIFKGQRDRRIIDVNDPVDVQYVHHQFPWLSHKQIREVIEEHGPDRETVQSVLEQFTSKGRGEN